MAVNLLLSYAFHAEADLKAIRHDLVCGNLMIDSGAFTAWSKGNPIDLNAYAEFLRTWSGCWDHAITLDVIGDHKATRANTHQLHQMGLPVMPVFTRGDTVANFDAMVREHGYVCVGGLVGLPVKAQRDRAAMLQRRAATQGGGIHALGIGSMAALRAAKPYSSDASSVSGAFKFGNVVYFTGSEVRNCQVTDQKRMTKDWAHIRAHGIDLATIAETRRMPNRQAGRKPLMQAMSLAYACADEVLKHQHPVPAPTGGQRGPQLYSSVIGQGGSGRGNDVYAVSELDTALHQGPQLYSSVAKDDQDRAAAADLDRQLHEGPHLYSSVTTSELTQGATNTDTALHHDGWCPPVWATHGRHHVCQR